MAHPFIATPPDELRRQADLYRRLAAAAHSPVIAERLRLLASWWEAEADEKDGGLADAAASAA